MDPRKYRNKAEIEAHIRTALHLLCAVVDIVRVSNGHTCKVSAFSFGEEFIVECVEDRAMKTESFMCPVE